MVIGIDAMGGDNAPGEIIKGALVACQNGRAIMLIGPCGAMIPEFGGQQPSQGQLNILDSGGMNPVDKGVRLLADGQLDAFVSAGNTKLLSRLAVRLGLPDVQPPGGGPKQRLKPPILLTLPNRYDPGSQLVLADAGAQVNCTAYDLFFFAVLARAFARYFLGQSEPRIGLLSIGREPEKLPPVLWQAHELFLAHPELGYAGPVEPDNAGSQGKTIIICSGWDGNLTLKGTEAGVATVTEALKRAFGRTWLNRIRYLLVRSVVGEVRHELDPAQFAGGLVGGLPKPVLVCHGKSHQRDIASAIARAEQFCRLAICEHLQRELQVYLDRS